MSDRDSTLDEVEALRARVRELEDEAARHRAQAAELEQRVSERTAELRQSSALLQRVLDNMPASVFIKDLEGRFLLINRRGLQAMKADAAQLIGRLDTEVIPPKMAATWREHRDRILATGESCEVESAFPPGASR